MTTIKHATAGPCKNPQCTVGRRKIRGGWSQYCSPTCIRIGRALALEAYYAARALGRPLPPGPSVRRRCSQCGGHSTGPLELLTACTWCTTDFPSTSRRSA